MKCFNPKTLCVPLLLLTSSFARAQDVSASGNAAESSAVSGTSGTPLGGFGAGAVKFNAGTGSFAAMTRPPADAFDFEPHTNAKFQFFAERDGKVASVDTMKASLVDGAPDDDAIWPLHLVNFGSLAEIQVNMTAFSPLDTENPERMSLPYAFYDLSLTNEGTDSAEAAVALQIDAGSAPVTDVPGKGFRSKPWSVYADTGGKPAFITAGSDDGFLANGECDNAPGSGPIKTAVKVELTPKQTTHVHFVLAWYEDSDPERSHYLGEYRESGDIAATGLANFDVLEANAERLVRKMRASNLPDWLKNQTLNTLVNLTTNSMYKKDGRVAFAEGQWTCFGTMDQMWHAREIVGQLVPFFAWRELRYWARTQMKNGQIHHDFNKMDVPNRALRSELVNWDDTEHEDYRNVQGWVDLNCGFIVSTYETYRDTGDQEQFDFLWPHVKRAAQRILDQVDQYGDKQFPYTFDHSENSYDAGGNPDPFNSSVSAVVYKIMMELATEKGETALADTYRNAYDTVVTSYRARYLNDAGFKTGKHCESYFGGQWLALHMQLGEIWSAADNDFVLEKLNGYYQPLYRGLGNASGTYDEWTPYILLHYGGLLLNTGRANQWEAMQKDDYNRQYLDRSKVFDHPLNVLPVVGVPRPASEEYRSKQEYISMPGLWRNYEDIVGYHRDARTGEIWLKPILLPELNHRMTDAMYVSPEGYGSISCTESGEYFQNKEIVFKPDNPIQLSTLHLVDDFGEDVNIKVNGKKMGFARSGTGYAKELLVNWNGTVDRDGMTVSISGSPGAAPPPLPEQLVNTEPTSIVVAAKVDAYEPIQAAAATKVAGTSIMKDAVGGAYVTSCHNFDYLQFTNVDFGVTGTTTFNAKVASNITGSSIDVVLDDVSGAAIGSCSVPRTGGDQAWVSASAPINKTTGVHTVFVRFYGNTEGNLMNIKEIWFGADGSASKH